MKILKFLGIVLFSTSLFAGTLKNEVPKAVRDAFAKKFPNARSVSWDEEDSSEWEAEFKMDGMEYSANFSNDGSWKETEHKVLKKDVPQKVMASLEREFSGYKIRESELSETSEGTAYEFEIKKGGSKLEVAIDRNGKLMSKEEHNGDDED